MSILDLTGLMDVEDLPMCPVCEQPLEFHVLVAHADGHKFMVHSYCASDLLAHDDDDDEEEDEA